MLVVRLKTINLEGDFIFFEYSTLVILIKYFI